MDYDVVFKLEKKLKELIDFTVKRRGFWSFLLKFWRKLCKNYSKFAWPNYENFSLLFNYPAFNCMKSLLIIYSMSPRLTSE